MKNLNRKFYFSFGLLVFMLVGGGFYFFLENKEKMESLPSSNLVGSFTSNGISLYHSGFDIVYSSGSCGKNMDVPFFLHAYFLDIDKLPENMKEDGFYSLDFHWSAKETREKYFPWEVCTASVALPFFYPVSKIVTGQHNGTTTLWQEEIDLREKRFVVSFQPFNLTDQNWQNGIRRANTGFFVENNFQNRQSLKVGDTLMFPHAGERVIKQLIYNGRYLNVVVSGNRLSPEEDGYPHAVMLRDFISEEVRR